jgi:protein required for attachment to host cells
MGTIWIVTANAGRARYFAQEQPGGTLQEVEDQVNAAARLRTADTETDDLGRRTGSAGTSRGATPNQASGYEPHQTPAEHQTELFARSVATALADAHRAGRYQQLVLAASPEFLGALRKRLDPQVAALIRTEIGKDYTQSSASQLRDQLAAQAAKA